MVYVHVLSNTNGNVWFRIFNVQNADVVFAIPLSILTLSHWHTCRCLWLMHSSRTVVKNGDTRVFLRRYRRWHSNHKVYNLEKLFFSTSIIFTWLWFHCGHAAFLTNTQVKTRFWLPNKMCRRQKSLVCFIPSNCWHLDSLRLWCDSLLFAPPERLNSSNYFLSNSPICITASFQFHTCCLLDCSLVCIYPNLNFMINHRRLYWPDVSPCLSSLFP